MALSSVDFPAPLGPKNCPHAVVFKSNIDMVDSRAALVADCQIFYLDAHDATDQNILPIMLQLREGQSAAVGIGRLREWNS